MKTITFLTGYWHFNTIAFLAAILLLFFHFSTNRWRFTRKSPVFLSGIVLMVLATFSPLDYLSKNFLFSAHMIQHILSLLVIPPLLLSGTDSGYLNSLSQKRGFRKVAAVIFHPVFAWLMGVGSMWVSHAPGLMMRMNDMAGAMDFQTIALLVLGYIFIWPVFTPVRLKKLDPLQSSLYLFLACVGCTALGILITFAPAGLFTSEMTGMDINIVTMIRTNWGITMNLDQQIGGLIMWVPACIIYLSYVLITLFRWFSAQDSGEQVDEELNAKEDIV
jgi:putative membrane protein